MRVKTRHRGVYYREDAKGKRHYIVWYADSNGKGRFETLPLGSTERDAVERRSELLAKLAKGVKVAPVKTPLEDWFKDWIADQDVRLAPKTITTYTEGFNRLPDWLKSQPVSKVDVDAVARAVAELQRSGLKAWSIRGTLRALSRCLAPAVRAGHLAVNPVRQLDKNERPKGDQRKMRILSTEEIERLLPAVPKNYRALITTLTFTGMRIGEALSLRWEHVDLAAGLITHGSKTEAGKNRSIVVMPSLGKVLREHKLASSYSQPGDLVFCTLTGKRMNERNVYRRGLDKGLEDAGVERVTLHELRHTYASILIGQGLDVTFVADQLGHADPAITLKVYAKLFDPKQRRDEAREKLEVAFAGVIG